VVDAEDLVDGVGDLGVRGVAVAMSSSASDAAMSYSDAAMSPEGGTAGPRLNFLVTTGDLNSSLESYGALPREMVICN